MPEPGQDTRPTDARPDQVDGQLEGEVMQRVTNALISELDLKKLVQRLTDEATALTRAQFGAYLYNVADGRDGAPHAISGHVRDSGEFPIMGLLRETALVGKTFEEGKTVRFSDGVQDGEPTDGHQALSMPDGLRSYLAVPVKLRSGEVHGGLFFGHREPNVFTEHDERMVRAVAAHAAIAIENARLYQQAKAAQVALQESMAGHRLLAEAADDGLWFWDIRTGTVEWSERLLTILGVPRESMRGSIDAFMARIHPEDRARWSSALEAHLNRRAPFQIAFRVRGAEGDYRNCSARGMAEWDKDGSPVRMAGAVSDVTDAKRVEVQIRFLSEASSILASSLDYEATLASLAKIAVPEVADFFAVDLVGESLGDIHRIEQVHVDPTRLALAWELFGRRPPRLEDMMGPGRVIATGASELATELSELAPPATEDDEELLSIFRRLELRSMIHVPLLARGAIVGALTLGSTGSNRRYVAHDREFAEELARRASLAIENAWLYRDAERSVRMKEDLLDVLSHDLKNPLASVINDVGILLKTMPADAHVDRQRMENVWRTSERMLAFLQSFIDLAQLEAGTVAFDTKQHDPSALVLEAVEMNRSAISEKGLTLMRAAAPRLSVLCDRRRIVHVLSRLIAHAVRVTPRGAKVTLHLEPGPGEVRIGVGDEGQPLAREQLDRLLAGNTRQRDRDGHAIGLSVAIAKAVVFAHGGRFWAESGTTGTTFLFTLPSGP
jgi:PAS domain S-box-containing protein